MEPSHQMEFHPDFSKEKYKQNTFKQHRNSNESLKLPAYLEQEKKK